MPLKVFLTGGELQLFFILKQRAKFNAMKKKSTEIQLKFSHFSFLSQVFFKLVPHFDVERTRIHLWEKTCVPGVHIRCN